ncbi:MAG: DUF5693 family protein [Endomicrobiia bacterium]
MDEQKIKLLKNLTISLIVISILVWTFRQIYLKIQYEKNNKNVEICVDFEQVTNLCKKENYELKNFLERIKIIGVSSMALPEENFYSICQDKNIIYFSEDDVKKYNLVGLIAPSTMISAETIVTKDKKLIDHLKKTIEFKTGLSPKTIKSGNYTIIKINEGLKQIGWGYHPDKVELIKKTGFGIILKPYKDFWIPDELPENFSSVMLVEKFNKEIIPEIKYKTIKIAVQEFSEEEKKYKKDLIPISENVFRMHRINSELIPELAFYRWFRAVRERNCRILYYDFYEELNIEENLNYLRNLSSKLKKEKFNLSFVQTQKKVSNLFGFFGKYFALIFSILTPLISIIYYKKNSYKNFIFNFCVISLINLLGSFLITALLSKTEFFLKLDEFRGVKLALISPLFFAVPILFSINEIKKFFLKPVNFFLVILAVLIFLFLQFAAIRTENISQITNTESWIRLSLEKIFGVRPRFKEFLIGHPLLLFGLAFNLKIFILLGLIGQTSLINTFLHVHTPFYICILRTIYGLIIGFLIGIFFIKVYKNCRRKIEKIIFV